MNKTLPIFAICLMLLLTSCSTLKGSLAIGIATGATAGGTLGTLIPRKQKKKWLITGSIIGAVLGGLGAYVTHDQLKKRDEKIRRETLFNLEDHDVTTINPGQAGPPQLVSPKVERIWVGPTNEGGKYVEGHYVWTITDEARWGQEARKEEKEEYEKEKKQKDNMEIVHEKSK